MADTLNTPEPPKAPTAYDVDDRGNIAQFYRDEEIVATLDREAEVGALVDQLTWDGDADITAWAIANGYADAIARATRVD